LPRFPTLHPLTHTTYPPDRNRPNVTHQEEKARQRNQEETRKLEAARKGKVAASSAVMVRKLQRKRFQQVFNFLDKTGCGFISLATVLDDPPEHLEELDDDVSGLGDWLAGWVVGWLVGWVEVVMLWVCGVCVSLDAPQKLDVNQSLPTPITAQVRADLEMSARLAVRAAVSPPQKFKHQDSGSSSASFFMPPPPSAEVQAARASGSAPPSPKPPVNPSRVSGILVAGASINTRDCCATAAARPCNKLSNRHCTNPRTSPPHPTAGTP